MKQKYKNENIVGKLEKKQERKEREKKEMKEQKNEKERKEEIWCKISLTQREKIQKNNESDKRQTDNTYKETS